MLKLKTLTTKIDLRDRRILLDCLYNSHYKSLRAIKNYEHKEAEIQSAILCHDIKAILKNLFDVEVIDENDFSYLIKDKTFSEIKIELQNYAYNLAIAEERIAC